MEDRSVSRGALLWGCYQPRTDRAGLLQVSAGKLEAICSTLWLAQSR